MSAKFFRLYQAIVSNDKKVYSELNGNSNTDVDILRDTVRHSEDTFLHVAANWKRRRIAEIIIDLQPSLLFATNAKGETPLHVAASAGSEHVTRLIIDRCCQIEAVETGETILRKKYQKEEDTALHKAVRNGHLGVVQLLIVKDPELTKLVNKDGDSPLFMAIYTRQLQIAGSILTISDCSFKGRKNMNALHATIAHRPEGIVTSLIEKREAGLLEQQDEDFGWTPLHYAAHLNDTRTIKRLLSVQHSLACIKDRKVMTALHIAAKQGHVGAVAKLVKICPEICGIEDDNGQTFFHIAVKSGRIRVVRQLFGGDFLNMQDYQGNTALHLAASEKHFFILFLLAMDHRFSKATTNSDGLTVLDILTQSQPLPCIAVRFRRATSTTGCTPGTKHLLGWTEIENSEKAVDKSSEMRQINLMVSTMIATVSFTAALSVPGGFKNDGPDEGTAALAHNDNFNFFTTCNAYAFFFSVISIFLSWYKLKFTHEGLAMILCQLATFMMALAFIGANGADLGPSGAAFARSAAVVTLVFSAYYGVVFLFAWLCNMKRESEAKVKEVESC